MSQRILITGGSGLLSVNWAIAIRDRYEVTLGMHSKNVVLSGVNCLNIDLESVEQLSLTMSIINPVVVIHTVGLTSIELCEANPSLARHINTELAENVAKACFKLGVPLVHISTDHLFEGVETLVSESHTVKPLNTYGHTKSEAENRIQNIYPKALIIRTNFFGWGTSYRQSFSDSILQSLRDGKEVTLFEDVYYTPILAETLALAVHELVECKESGVFNVVGDQRVSKYDFGLRLAEQFGLDSRLVKPGLINGCSNLVKRPKNMCLSNKKIYSVLNRKLGGVVQHIARLHQQEQLGQAQELSAL
jgi:dTDP-4-dehydrorhamnose reductase